MNRWGRFSPPPAQRGARHPVRNFFAGTADAQASGRRRGAERRRDERPEGVLVSGCGGSPWGPLAPMWWSVEHDLAAGVVGGVTITPPRGRYGYLLGVFERPSDRAVGVFFGTLGCRFGRGSAQGTGGVDFRRFPPRSSLFLSISYTPSQDNWSLYMCTRGECGRLPPRWSRGPMLLA